MKKVFLLLSSSFPVFLAAPPAFAQQAETIHVAPLLFTSQTGMNDDLSSFVFDCKESCGVNFDLTQSESPPWSSSSGRISLEIADQWSIFGASGRVSGVKSGDMLTGFASQWGPLVSGKFVGVGVEYQLPDSFALGFQVNYSKFNLDVANAGTYRAIEFSLVARKLL